VAWSERAFVQSASETSPVGLLSEADPPAAARLLLGATLHAKCVVLRIVETEAYGSGADGPWPDPASHAYPRQTNRNTVMFGPAGRMYLYRIYGMHICANVSFGPEGAAGAVLLRAAEVVDGVELASRRRPGVANANGYARGPANLARSAELVMDDQGVPLFEGGPIQLVLGPRLAAADGVVACGPRVGILKASEVPWRFWFRGNAAVSAYRRHPKAGPPASSEVFSGSECGPSSMRD
jgi:DNA-3-methyladenine glycosylase